MNNYALNEINTTISDKQSKRNGVDDTEHHQQQTKKEDEEEKEKTEDLLASSESSLHNIEHIEVKLPNTLPNETEKDNSNESRQIPDIVISSDENQSLANTTAKTAHAQSHTRNRTDSIKQFRTRFLSFSNDVMRSIENAHEMIDLKNSNFSAATQSAASQQYKHNMQQKQMQQHYLDVPYYTSKPGQTFKQKHSFSKRNSMHQYNDDANIDEATDEYCLRDDVSVSSVNTIESNPKNERPMRVSKSDSTGEVLASRTNDVKISSNSSLNIEKTKPLVNANTQLQFENEIYYQNENKAADTINGMVNHQSQSTQQQQRKVPKEQHKDEADFRVKKRYILTKNGSKKSIPDDIHISILEVFIYLWGVITFFADLISDIILSIEYFNSSRRWLGSLTLLFVIVPNVTLSLFSLSWYIDKYYVEKQLLEQQQKLEQQQQQKDTISNGTKHHNHNIKISSTCDSITFWVTTIFFVVFQLDLVWKYIQGFVYTLKGWACRSLFKNLKWEKYYIEKQIKCDTDIGMLRLIDVFMDSGPQVLLQLYVITTQNLNELGSGNLVVFTFKDFQTTSLELKQLVSILSSLFSMGYALAGYHRCLRNQQFIFCLETNKPLPRPMRWISTIMQFLWYLFLIAPRVLSMALFASTFRSWFFMIIFTHWLIMYFWILRLKTNYCITSQDVYNAREEIFEKFYDFVCSFIYIFVYFNLKAGPTRLRYLIYYMVFYSENVLFCVCYFTFSNETNFTYKLTMLLVIIFGFWIALTFQIVYYLHCHPSHDIRICVRKKAKFHFIHKETLKPSSLYESDIGDDDNDIDEHTIFEMRNTSAGGANKKSATSNSNELNHTNHLLKPNKISTNNSTNEKLQESISSSISSLTVTSNYSKSNNTKEPNQINDEPKNSTFLHLDDIEKIKKCESIAVIKNTKTSMTKSPGAVVLHKLVSSTPHQSLINCNKNSLYSLSSSKSCSNASISSLNKTTYDLDMSQLSLDALNPPLAKMNEFLTENEESHSNDELKSIVSINQKFNYYLINRINSDQDINMLHERKKSRETFL